MRLQELRKALSQKQQAYAHAQSTLSTEQINLDQANKKQEALAEIQNLLQQAAQSIQTQAHQRIATLVTEALASIFQEEAPSFEIAFERKRGKTEAILSFRKGELLLSPLDASGGGVVDVAAFALRLAAITLARPRRRSLLILDEPFRFVSRDYLPRVRSLLERLSSELGIQIVLVTHLAQLQTENSVEISR